jgi:hypothetical protein
MLSTFLSIFILFGFIVPFRRGAPRRRAAVRGTGLQGPLQESCDRHKGGYDGRRCWSLVKMSA